MMPGEAAAPSPTEYLCRRVLRKDAKDPVALPIGNKDSKGYHPRTGEFNIGAYYVVNHGKQAAEPWTLAHVTQLPKLVKTRRYGMRWQCKVMLYAKNGLAQKSMKFLPEKRRGTENGWETVNCQSLAFLASKLPGKKSNREMTKPHQDRLAQILHEWAEAVESEEEEVLEEEEREKEGGKEEVLDDEKADPTYVDEPGSQSGESSEASDEDND